MLFYLSLISKPTHSMTEAGDRICLSLCKACRVPVQVKPQCQGQSFKFNLGHCSEQLFNLHPNKNLL